MTVEQRFSRLRDDLENRTAFWSTGHHKDAAYQEIVAMGLDAVPLLIAELREKPRPCYFSILNEITDAQPVPEEDLGYILKMGEHWAAWWDLQQHPKLAI